MTTIPEPGTTTRKRRNKSKEKGTAAERAVVDFLRAHGFPGAERRALRGAQDAGDVTGCPGLCVEVKGGDAAKNASDLLVADWLEETEKERINARADIGVLVLQRRGVGPANAGRWWAVMRLWTVLYAQSQADRDAAGIPAFTANANTFEIGASDPTTPWMYAPVRMLLADAVRLLRAAGYGDALEPGVSE